MKSKLLDARTVYEQARQEQSRNGAVPLRRLPPWENLPPEIREAMIHIFYAGRIEAIQEADNRRVP
jgi:hypothetical protein